MGCRLNTPDRVVDALEELGRLLNETFRTTLGFKPIVAYEPVVVEAQMIKFQTAHSELVPPSPIGDY